jgi:hypothetical protein
MSLARDHQLDSRFRVVVVAPSLEHEPLAVGGRGAPSDPVAGQQFRERRHDLALLRGQLEERVANRHLLSHRDAQGAFVQRWGIVSQVWRSVKHFLETTQRL